MTPSRGFTGMGEAFDEPGCESPKEGGLPGPAHVPEGGLQRPAKFRLGPDLPFEDNGFILDQPAGPFPACDQGPRQALSLLGLAVRFKQMAVEFRGLLPDFHEQRPPAVACSEWIGVAGR